MQSSLTIIVAMDAQHGIGIRNTLPWHLPEDLAHFKRLTTGHPIIMGRKTFDSIGRALPNRRNIVITRNSSWHHNGAETASSLTDALSLIGNIPAYIIGGAQIYAEALPYATHIIATEIDKTFDCDAFFPDLVSQEWMEVHRESHHSDEQHINYAFVTYQRIT